MSIKDVSKHGLHVYAASGRSAILRLEGTTGTAGAFRLQPHEFVTLRKIVPGADPVTMDDGAGCRLEVYASVVEPNFVLTYKGLSTGPDRVVVPRAWLLEALGIGARDLGRLVINPRASASRGWTIRLLNPDASAVNRNLLLTQDEVSAVCHLAPGAELLIDDQRGCRVKFYRGEYADRYDLDFQSIPDRETVDGGALRAALGYVAKPVPAQVAEPAPVQVAGPVPVGLSPCGKLRIEYAVMRREGTAQHEPQKGAILLKGPSATQILALGRGDGVDLDDGCEGWVRVYHLVYRDEYDVTFYNLHGDLRSVANIPGEWFRGRIGLISGAKKPAPEPAVLAAQTSIDWAHIDACWDRVVRGPVSGELYYANATKRAYLRTGGTFDNDRHIVGDWEAVGTRPVVEVPTPAAPVLGERPRTQLNEFYAQRVREGVLTSKQAAKLFKKDEQYLLANSPNHRSSTVQAFDWAAQPQGREYWAVRHYNQVGK